MNHYYVCASRLPNEVDKRPPNDGDLISQQVVTLLIYVGFAAYAIFLYANRYDVINHLYVFRSIENVYSLCLPNIYIYIYLSIIYIYFFTYLYLYKYLSYIFHISIISIYFSI